MTPTGPAPRIDRRLLALVEDAALNASAPPEQRWLDGWLLRLSPGKAKRARCIHAIAVGELPLDDRLARAVAAYDAAGLPVCMRITPFTQPADLDALLAARGWAAIDDTRVMLCTTLEAPGADTPLPPGWAWRALQGVAFAEVVGALRGSPAAHNAALTRRLQAAVVPFDALAIVDARGEVVACAQAAREDDRVGLYDVVTAPGARRRGLARALCTRLLARAHAAGARVAHLQVDAANPAARALYATLGFVDAYSYHYRVREPQRF